MNDPKQKEGTQIPGWLKTIQLNSWEAELLTSALVLYALFQVPDFIEQFTLTNFERASLFHRFSSILEKAVELLSIGYITHILVRGVWVANVGFSYVFPNGINKDRLKFKGKFAKEIDGQGSIVKGVLRLEELSSLIYGISFLLFGLILGFGTLILPFIALSQAVGTLIAMKSQFAVVVGFGMLFYMIAFFFLFIDFVTNGIFRRIEWTAKIYYPISLVFRVLTVSFLYRRALLVLISNVKGWKAYLIPIVLFVVTVSFMTIKSEMSTGERVKYLEANRSMEMVPANYEDKRKDGDYFIASIQSDVISESVLRLYLDDLSMFSSLYTRNSTLGGDWEDLNSKESSDLLNKWINFSIDSTKIYQPQWHISRHPRDLSFGFSAFVDISDLERGPHSFSMAFDTTDMDEIRKKIITSTEYSKLTLSNIQFFYSP